MKRFAITFLLALWGPAIAQSQSFSFQPPATYPAQSSALVTVTADFNGDGRLDLAVANAGASTVSIYLGTGGGAFAAPTVVTIPGGCFNDNLTAGDFNNDGVADLLAVCGFQNEVWFLPGLGSGKFGTPVSTRLPLSVANGWVMFIVNGVAVADFNRDGRLDLVAILVTSFSGSLQGEELALMLGNGDGTFSAPSAIPNTVGDTVVTGDFDGDGIPDLAVSTLSTGADSMIILRGKGDGSFQSLATYPVQGSTLLGNLIVADVNRDGHPDLILAAGNSSGGIAINSQLVVFIGKGDGSFTPGWSASEGNVIPGLAVGDFQGTGTPSLIEENIVEGATGLAIGQITMTLRAGNGDGTFQAPVPISTPAGLSPWWFNMAVGDWNGDGLPDLAFTASPSSAELSGTGGGDSFVSAYQGMPAASLVVMVNASSPPAFRFVPITPCRIADTRNTPSGPFAGPTLIAQAVRDFAIPLSACHIPATAQAYSFNVAVVPQGPLGYLTMWPGGQPQPFVATINSDGRVKSTAAIIPAGAAGAVSVYTTNTTDLVLDINGYFVPSSDPTGLSFYPVTPCRIGDTRNPTNPGVQIGGPTLAANETRTFAVQSTACSLPASAKAYSFNFAALPQAPLVMTAWPTGVAQPVAASVNAVRITPTANAVIVPAGSGGAINVWTNSASDLVIDVNGYFAAAGAGGLSLYNLLPCRVLDSRQPSGSPPFMGVRTVNVTGSSCAPPSSAQSYLFNATAVPAGSLGYLTLWPQGTAQPAVSTLNAVDGAITGNMAIVQGNSGSISAFAPEPTQLVLDLFGYFAP